MSDQATAWLLTPAEGTSFAVGSHEIKEYLLETTLHAIPHAPRYCSSIMNWHSYFVPVMDFRILFGLDSKEPFHGIIVVAWQEKKKSPLQYLGIGLVKPPLRISVRNSQACEMIENTSIIKQAMTLTCFAHEGVSIPVLDIALMGSSQFRKLIREWEESETVRHLDTALENQTPAII